MDIRFLGHAAFEIADGSARILIDPFLKPGESEDELRGRDPRAGRVLHTLIG